MGFRFRKSFGKGPFRLNISKSGIGWSIGGKGARYTKKATGGTRITLSVPGTGISYVTETSKKKPKKEKTMKKRVKASVVANENPKPKKPFYKRWWFWAIIVICLISSCTGGKDIPPVDETPSVVIEETVDTESFIETPEETLVPEVTEPPVTEITPPVVEETKKPEVTPPTKEETAPPAQTEPIVTYVLITPTGEKYHDAGCGRINVNTCTQMTKEDAIAAGYSACGVCKPK